MEAIDTGASAWRRLLMVVTADCDFAHEKHQGRVTCVPILSQADYLRELVVPTIREKLMDKPLSELKRLAAKAGYPAVTLDKLRAWVNDSDEAEVIQALEISARDSEIAKQCVASIKLLDSKNENLEAESAVLVAAQLSGPNPPSKKNAAEKVLNALRSPFQSPPGDCMFIGEVAPDLNDGYFAYLRHIEQLWQPEVATASGAVNAKYRRISRLQDRFSHALTQKFGMVFMSIGLPVEYEESRALYALSVGGNLE